MGYENLFAAHLLPIAKFRRTAPGQYEPIRAAGTGFTFGEGTFISCWHCVSNPVEKDEVYCAVIRTAGIESQAYDEVFELAYLEQDANGSDLAPTRVDYTIDPMLALAEEPAAWGEDVVASGYPLPLNTRDPDTRQVKIDMNAMLLRGYVMRLRIDDRPGVRPVRAYELDMLAPPGASGSPMFRPHPLEVVGVVYGEQDVQMAEGKTTTFAYAHHLSTLREARGAATQRKPLHEFLADQYRLRAEGQQDQGS